MSEALRELSCSNCGAPMHAQSTAGQQVLKCEYCGRSHVFAAPPKERAQTRAGYRVGEAILVKWGGQWWPGRIEREVAEGAWEISYDGWGKSWNETVGKSRLARAADATDEDGEDDAVPHDDEPARPPASNAAVASRFRAGQPVRVLWNNKWWDGRVVKVIAADAWEISYDGYATSWNEVVGPDRIMDRGATPAIATAQPSGGPTVGVAIGALVGVLVLGGVVTGFFARSRTSSSRSSSGYSYSYSSTTVTPGTAVNVASLRTGSAVLIHWNNSWYPGHVVSLEAGGLVRVRYDAYSSSWDESVPPSRLRSP